MRKKYRRDVIREARDAWFGQYANYSDEKRLLFSKQTIGETRVALRSLDLDTCSAGDVNNAIGATGWASNCCDECKRDFDVLMHIGQESNYEARYQQLCIDCLRGAVSKLADDVPSHEGKNECSQTPSDCDKR